jgi:hypothetical protein
MSCHSCTYNGFCEADAYGYFNSDGSCEAPIHRFKLQSTLDLEPSDRVQVLKEITGVAVKPEDSYEILEDITARNLWNLNQHPSLKPFVATQTTGLDRLLLYLLEFMVRPQCPVDYRRLRANIARDLKPVLVTKPTPCENEHEAYIEVTINEDAEAVDVLRRYTTGTVDRMYLQVLYEMIGDERRSLFTELHGE